MMCRCGCEGEALWLVTGFGYEPHGKGAPFVDEPACHDAAVYLEETALELGLPPVSKRPAPGVERV